MLQYLPETSVEGKRLGAHFEKDERSRQFGVKALLPGAVPLVKQVWTRKAAVFDQGSLGSCTGNAVLGMRGTAPFTGLWSYTEKFAQAIYAGATDEDGFSDPPWPTNDRGSTLLGALKAGRIAGLYSAYRWAFSFDEALQTLSHYGPIVMAGNWYDSMDHPDAQGLVSISPGAVSRGGHAWEVAETYPDDKLLGCWQSWGNWALAGRFFISFDTFARIQSENGEVGTIVR